MKIFQRRMVLKGVVLTGLLMTTFTAAFAEKKATVVSAKSPQTIYYNGDIITMEGNAPEYVEAVVTHEGKIVFIGSKDEAFKRFDGKADLYDLQGNTLFPGFIDGHSHVYFTGSVSMMADLLPPPDGPGNGFDSIVNTTKTWMETDDGKLLIKKYGWVLGNGYDDSQLKETEHPTTKVLDRITTEYPVMIIHQSGHLAAVNTKALEILGYNKDSKNPKGGVIRRNSDGSPNGVLEEASFFDAMPLVFKNTDSDIQAHSVQKGQEEYVKYGYTTAQEGRATPEATDALAAAADNEKLFIDVVTYPDIVTNSKALESGYYNPKHQYKSHYRIGGVKLTLDGSPQGKTAWLTEPYFKPPLGEETDYVGFPIMSDEDAEKYVKMAYKNKWQILSHTNGDAAIDQYLKAVKVARAEYGYDDPRTVLIHGQTLRKDQIPLVVELDIYPSLFPLHTFYWGDWHVNSVLGHPRADYISPMRDVVDAGRTVTSHHDAPVTHPDAMRVLDATVNRVTRSGKILGPEQRLTAYEGLKALTDWASIQYFEEASKGTLKEGKLADFVILEKNPLKVETLTIKDIKVVETIKEGNSVFKD